MTRIIFTIPGNPAHSARMRAAVIGGHARVYAPKANVVSGKVIRDYAIEAMNGSTPLEGPVRLEVAAVYLWPKSWSRKKCERERFKTSRPDASNILKHVEDNLNAIIWKDDAQIAAATIEKLYGPIASTTVVVETIRCPSSSGT